MSRLAPSRFHSDAGLLALYLHSLRMHGRRRFYAEFRNENDFATTVFGLSRVRARIRLTEAGNLRPEVPQHALAVFKRNSGLHCQQPRANLAVTVPRRPFIYSRQACEAEAAVRRPDGLRTASSLARNRLKTT
jgi:hypothetical protein